MIIHLREHEARHFAKNKEVLVVRPVKIRPYDYFNTYKIECGTLEERGSWGFCSELYGYQCPLGKPGDVVDCKEAWGYKEHDFSGREIDYVFYKSTTYDEGFFWRSSIYMPNDLIRPSFRGVKVEGVDCRKVNKILIYEARMNGFECKDDMAKIYGVEEVLIKEQFNKYWQTRYGKQHPWHESWAWFVKLRRG